MNDAPHNLNRPNDAGLRDRLSALKDPTVMFGLICPVPGFLLLESSLGLVVYMALVLLALATKARKRQSADAVARLTYSRRFADLPNLGSSLCAK